MIDNYDVTNAWFMRRVQPSPVPTSAAVRVRGDARVSALLPIARAAGVELCPQAGVGTLGSTLYGTFEHVPGTTAWSPPV